VFVYTSFYYLSQHNNYQELIHVTCVNEFIGGTILQHVSTHRTIIRQYTLITIYHIIDLNVNIYYNVMIICNAPDSYLVDTG
jgi:hypothetical protein